MKSSTGKISVESFRWRKEDQNICHNQRYTLSVLYVCLSYSIHLSLFLSLTQGQIFVSISVFNLFVYFLSRSALYLYNTITLSISVHLFSMYLYLFSISITGSIYLSFCLCFLSINLLSLTLNIIYLTLSPIPSVFASFHIRSHSISFSFHLSFLLSITIRLLKYLAYLKSPNFFLPLSYHLFHSLPFISQIYLPSLSVFCWSIYLTLNSLSFSPAASFCLSFSISQRYLKLTFSCAMV